jgi:hypothetical protein
VDVIFVTRRAAAAAFLILSACGGEPADVPLVRLAAEQEAYDGRTVSTEGRVVPIEDPPAGEPYFVLEDHAGNRVHLLPDATARPYVGESVTVTGAFRFDPNAGRQLEIETIESSG